MAGHSQFKNIMVRKGKQDAKRGKIFTKIIREIISAARSGNPDPSSNPRLRGAIQWAREENMPRDKIEAAIKRGSGNAEGDSFEPVRYEGYGAGGVAVIVQALTDNRNRTASEIRSIFTKCGGNMAEPGSVAFMFDYVGIILYNVAAASDDAIMEAAIEAGATDCESSTEGHLITTSPEDFLNIREALAKLFGAAERARLSWQAKMPLNVSEEISNQLAKLLETLEDNDDVQDVFSNAVIN